MPKYTQKDNLLIQRMDIVNNSMSDFIDMGAVSDIGIRDGYQIRVDAPALTGTQLPASAKIQYSLIFTPTDNFDSDSDDYVQAIEAKPEWMQQGTADGCPEFTFYFTPDLPEQHYVALKTQIVGTNSQLAGTQAELSIVG